MNLAELHKKLIGAASADAPDDHVPYAFETRVMALLASRAVVDNLELWVRGLWRAAVSCVAISLLLGAWSFLVPSRPANANDLSQNFVTTLLASVDPSDTNP
jgi:hypothetical protein